MFDCGTASEFCDIDLKVRLHDDGDDSGNDGGGGGDKD